MATEDKAAKLQDVQKFIGKSKKTVNIKKSEFKDNSVQGVMGYIEGYQYQYLNNDLKADPDISSQHLTSAKINKNEINSNVKLTSYDVERKTTMPTYHEDTFKYGIEDNQNQGNWIEDPLLPAFELLISSHNPNGGYFNGILGNGPQTAIDFLTKYGTNSNNNILDKRITLLNEFTRIFKKIFTISNNLDDSNYDASKSKSHYITSIEGLDKLKEKIVKYKEDKLVITMNEDIGMTTMYLAELYNNMSYDYNNQRYMVPENCLRFDMAIKINDVRNIRYASEQGDSFNISDTKSYLMYVLRDCNFNFTNTQNHPATIDVGGFGSVSYNPVQVTFEIFYKSIEKIIAPYGRNIYDSSYVLDNKENVIQSSKNSKFDAWSNDLKDLNQEAERKKRDIQRDKPTTVTGIAALNDPKNKFTVKTQIVQKAKKFAISKMNEYRGELINLLLEDLEKSINIPVMYPENVYTTDVGEKSLENFVNSLTSDAYKNIIKTVKYGSENAIGNKLNNI